MKKTPFSRMRKRQWGKRKTEEEEEEGKTVETEGMKYFNVGWLWDPQRGGHTDGSGASTANGVQDFAHG